MIPHNFFTKISLSVITISTISVLLSIGSNPICVVFACFQDLRIMYPPEMTQFVIYFGCMPYSYISFLFLTLKSVTMSFDIFIIFFWKRSIMKINESRVACECENIQKGLVPSQGALTHGAHTVTPHSATQPSLRSSRTAWVSYAQQLSLDLRPAASSAHTNKSIKTS